MYLFVQSETVALLSSTDSQGLVENLLGNLLLDQGVAGDMAGVGHVRQNLRQGVILEPVNASQLNQGRNCRMVNARKVNEQKHLVQR